MNTPKVSKGFDESNRSFVTLAFTDLCGSTELANSLDPDVFAAVLGTLHDAVRQIVAQHGGIVSQVYGDGSLSVYQGPGSSERALAATLAVHAAARALVLPRETPRARLVMHSGVHAGLVVTGTRGAEFGTIGVIGRATGVAARLSASARPDEILVSQRTLGPTDMSLRIGPVRLVVVSGASDQIAAVPVLGPRPSDEAVHPFTRGRRTPLVGRADALEAIAHDLFAYAGATPLCIAVTGPPGQGKSRLSEEIELRAAEVPAVVLRGAAVWQEAASTLQPFREIEAAAARLLGEASQTSGDDDDLTVLGEAVLDRLQRLARQRRILLILDDWHWADSASLQLLGRVRSLDAGIAILLLSREAAPGELPLAADKVIDLPPIAEPPSVALVRRLRPELDTLDCLRVSRLAGGNPLYLEELCLISARTLNDLLAGESNSDEIGRIAAIIEARVRALPPDLTEVLQTAAVMGGDCAAWILSRLCGIAPGSPALVRLGELELLIPSLTPGNLRFKHGITRNVVYQLTHVDQRRALHSKVAELIEHQEPDPGIDRDELLAWHYYESRQFERAIVHAERAGDRAVAAASIDRAQLHYGRALRVVDQLSDEASHADHVRLIGKYGYACVYDSDRSQLIVFDRAARAAAARGDREGEAVARFWYGFVCHGSGQASRAVAELDRAVDLLPPAGQSAFAVQLRATQGQALAAAGRYERAAPLLDAAIDVKRAHRSGRNVSVGTAYSLALKAALLADTGHFSQARALIDEAVGLIAGVSHPVEGSVMGWSAAVRYWQGDWAGLLETARRGCDVALRIETVYIHAISRAFASYAQWRLTDAEDAAEELADAVACMADRGKELALSIAYGCLADMEAARGNVAATRAAVRQAYARARAGEPFGMPVAARAWARLCAAEDPGRARRMLLHARGNARRRGALHELARCDVAEAALGLVPAAVAATRLAQAAAAFERMGMTEDLRHARTLMGTAEALPSLRVGR
ncbi:AAA family ATPase [Sphingomonas sp. HF-S4]|uniref:AAA family ATPase n=1 Tax=Sphingomonas agrestis TaxID=3080540 RepID=A0ABU3Y926_9SPHN|nr:AAA family ATPase [Sphingomonas sp. HF-S4]MDV3457923.1 AAA family ATPase [Sphingomonas sp. HF-S4]